MSSNFYMVVAPMAGTFYEASYPGEPPLVTVGQKVAKGEVVCIVESMKVFAEIRAEKSGKVSQVLVGNEDPLQLHQPIIEIELD